MVILAKYLVGYISKNLPKYLAGYSDKIFGGIFWQNIWQDILIKYCSDYFGKIFSGKYIVRYFGKISLRKF